jgi:hypothetical protein
MDITDQLQKIGFLLAENGFITILKKMTAPAVPPIEVYGVSG